jgi:diphosphomevalonate decarboxylase
MDRETFLQKASRLARLGSGSASRSVYPRFALWGQHSLWKDSSDEYAIPVQGIHQSFHKIRDSILIVESGAKKISSSAGHGFMDKHPYAKVRFRQAGENLEQLYLAMKEGDWPSFISLVEEEALSLHALMMAGRPGYILMQPATLSILQLIREYRKDSGNRMAFTLDAGANVHLLYAEADAPQVESFISSELAAFCENGWIIRDTTGDGPEKSGP